MDCPLGQKKGHCRELTFVERGPLVAVSGGSTVFIPRHLFHQSRQAVACERRRISGCHLVPPKINVCEPEPENDFCDVGILSQSQFSSSNPRTTARGIRCGEHSSFILSWNLISQGETKVIASQKSFPCSGSQTLFFGGTK